MYDTNNGESTLKEYSNKPSFGINQNTNPSYDNIILLKKTGTDDTAKLTSTIIFTFANDIEGDMTISLNNVDKSCTHNGDNSDQKELECSYSGTEKVIAVMLLFSSDFKYSIPKILLAPSNRFAISSEYNFDIEL